MNVSLREGNLDPGSPKRRVDREAKVGRDPEVALGVRDPYEQGEIEAGIPEPLETKLRRGSREYLAGRLRHGHERFANAGGIAPVRHTDRDSHAQLVLGRE
jgi:hypothetical protein